MSDIDQDFAAFINSAEADGWMHAMGIKLTRAQKDEVVAEWVVGKEHLQPYGLVHGGVHAGVIESVASIGAALNVIERGCSVVGLENHTTFVRAVRSGKLRARGTPITRGRKSQVWNVDVFGEDEKLVASGRVRLLVLEPGSELAGQKTTSE